MTVLELLSAVPEAPERADLTVLQVAERFGRAASTVREWIASGRLEAYRLRGREYRVTRGALEAFEKNERQRTNTENGVRASRGSLRDWRSVRPAG